MATSDQFQSPLCTQTATIPNGGSLSGAIDLGGTALVGIQMPSGWDAAALTFQASADGITFAELYDAAGNVRSLTTAASHSLYLVPSEWLGIRYLKVRSGTSGSPVNQTADRALTLISRPLAG